MNFDDTPQDLIEIATAIAHHYTSNQQKVFTERALNDDAPLRTTLFIKKGRESILIEVQNKPILADSIKHLATWMRQSQTFASLYLAISVDHEIPGRIMPELKSLGVGLLLVEGNGHITTVQDAVTFSLLVPPHPNHALGNLKTRVFQMCTRFNSGNQIDPLRDLFELTEGETLKLALKASAKGWINKTNIQIENSDWSNHINILSSANCLINGHPQLIDQKLKDDLHSFRGARNLMDHPPRTATANNKRKEQFKERMIQGPRLLSELLRLLRKIK